MPKRKRPRPDGRPPRPPNAFLLYLRDYRERLHKQENAVGVGNPIKYHVAKQAGIAWKEETLDVVYHYYQRAAELLSEYEKLYTSSGQSSPPQEATHHGTGEATGIFAYGSASDATELNTIDEETPCFPNDTISRDCPASHGHLPQYPSMGALKPPLNALADHGNLSHTEVVPSPFCISPLPKGAVLDHDDTEDSRLRTCNEYFTSSSLPEPSSSTETHPTTLFPLRASAFSESLVEETSNISTDTPSDLAPEAPFGSSQYTWPMPLPRVYPGPMLTPSISISSQRGQPGHSSTTASRELRKRRSRSTSRLTSIDMKLSI